MTDSTGLHSSQRESWIGRGNNALMRGIGASGTALIGVLCIGLSFSGLLPFSRAVGAWPGANLVIALAIAVGCSLVLAYTYAVIGSAVPRSGADYILASRVLSGPAGFISSWVFVLSSGLAAGSLIAYIPKTVFPVFAKALPVATNASWPNELANTLAQPQAMIVAGTLLVLIAFFSMFATQRTLLRILAGGLVFVLLAWGIVIFTFAVNTSSSFQAAWDQAMGAGSFDKVIPTAQRLGFDPGAGANALVPFGIVLGFWIFFGAFSSTFFAGEVKKPERTLLRGSWTALILAGAVLIAVTWLAQRVIAPEWMAAESFLSQASGTSGQAMPFLYFYTAILLPGLPLVVALLAAWVVSLVSLVQTYMFYTSRILLAWADDGLLPAGMAFVHPRFRSPLVTMLVAAVLVQIGLMDGLAWGGISSPGNFLYFAAATMLLPVTAVTVFPFLRRTWFEACPGFVRLKLGPVPVISLVGVFTLFYLIWILISPVIMPGGLAPGGVTGIIVFGGEVLTGALWYLGRWAVLRAQGTRLEETVKSMPRSS